MTETETETEAEADAKTELDQLPPGARFVEHVLEHQGPLTRADLREETQLPESTLQDALARLEEFDRITTEPSSDDARQSQFDIAE